MRLEDVIQRPLVTEKATLAKARGNVFCFAVHPQATKPQIAAALMRLLGVKALAIQTSCCRGKQKRVGRYMGKRPDWKRAYVRLPEKATIELLERK